MYALYAASVYIYAVMGRRNGSSSRLSRALLVLLRLRGAGRARTLLSRPGSACQTLRLSACCAENLFYYYCRLIIRFHVQIPARLPVGVQPYTCYSNASTTMGLRAQAGEIASLETWKVANCLT